MIFLAMRIPFLDLSEIGYDVTLLEALLASARLSVILNCGSKKQIILLFA